MTGGMTCLGISLIQQFGRGDGGDGGRPALLSSGLSLQSNKARPHTALHNVKQIQDLQLEVLTPSAMFIRFDTTTIFTSFSSQKTLYIDDTS